MFHNLSFIFEVNNSLTARSVSRQVRNGLKKDDHPRGSEKYSEQRSGQVLRENN